jgi:hypothetical protein
MDDDTSGLFIIKIYQLTCLSYRLNKRRYIIEEEKRKEICGRRYRQKAYALSLRDISGKAKSSCHNIVI